MAIREKWPKRELERQLKSGLFLRAVANPPKVSAVLTQIHPLAETVFKDAYSLEFLGQDFSLDLLFFHRGLNALVAIELKARRFEPEDLGKLNFYLEALDRDHRKPHETPSVGMLLYATKGEEVVEYALSRSLSPAMVSEYQIQMPDKKLLQAKLHEFYQTLAPSEPEDAP